MYHKFFVPNVFFASLFSRIVSIYVSLYLRFYTYTFHRESSAIFVTYAIFERLSNTITESTLRFHSGFYEEPRRSSAIRFNFMDPGRSTSRVTEIEISPSARDVSRIADMRAGPRYLRGKKIYSNVCRLCARSSEMQIFILEWIYNPTALIMLSRSPREELNTGSEMAAGKYTYHSVSPGAIIRDSFLRISEKCNFALMNFIQACGSIVSFNIILYYDSFSILLFTLLQNM